MTTTTTVQTQDARVRRHGWPGLEPAPTGPLTRPLASATERLVARTTRRLGIDVLDPATPPRPGRPTLVVHRPDECYGRLGRDRLIGFGEGYLTGAWDSPDLHLLLTTLAREMSGLVPGWVQRLRRVGGRREPSRSGLGSARDDVAHHYDLSNDLFATFLDETMTYSAALALAPGDDLATAQRRKLDRALDRAGVGPGTRLLEIGTGWGELAIRAADRGARVTSVTLSHEQQRLARDRVEAVGHGGRVDVRLLDYRQVTGEYDAIVSIEMVEAVGHAWWPTYFATLDRLLAPGGRACIQAITMPHDRMLASRGGHTFITKYVFPGGALPSVEAIDRVTREHTRLHVAERLMFGADYAETLRRWDEAFLAAGDEVAALGFDDTFRRLWHFYLTYSRAGFDAGYLDVGQFTLARRPG